MLASPGLAPCRVLVPLHDFADTHRARIDEDFLTFMRRQRGSAS